MQVGLRGKWIPRAISGVTSRRSRFMGRCCAQNGSTTLSTVWESEWQYIQHRSVCCPCTQTWKNNGHFIFGSSFNQLCYQCARPRRWRPNHAVWILNVVNIPRGKKFKQPLLFTWTGNYTIAEIYLVPRALNFDGLISFDIHLFCWQRHHFFCLVIVA